MLQAVLAKRSCSTGAGVGLHRVIAPLFPTSPEPSSITPRMEMESSRLRRFLCCGRLGRFLALYDPLQLLRQALGMR